MKTKAWTDKDLEQAYLDGSKDKEVELKKAIEDFNLELFLTDIKDKEGNKVELSDEIMEIIQIWWEQKEQELLARLEANRGKE